jgi:hypothetical protein
VIGADAEPSAGPQQATIEGDRILVAALAGAAGRREVTA